MTYTRALVVDDDPRVCRIVEQVAGRLGLETLAVENPEKFQTSVAYFRPDIIILDLQMEQVDGVELLRELARLDVTTTIMLTSGCEPRLLRASTDLGRSLGLSMVEPIPKPIEIAALRSRLSTREAAGEPDRPAQAQAMSATRLAQAIRGDELEVRYQPYIELASGQLLGVEALVRWHDPEIGVVPPERFIPAAERTDLIRPLTSRVLSISMQTLASWRTEHPDLALSVNLSQALLSDLDLPDHVQSLLRFYEIEPHRLTLEVTETFEAGDITHAMDVLTRLRLKGIRVAVDDFGTGTASLDQLYRLPYDILKIDRSFVADVARSHEAVTLVRSTIELAKSYGVDVVAEGVESQEILERLTGLGCEMGQGFAIAPPLDGDGFLTWAAERVAQTRRTRPPETPPPAARGHRDPRPTTLAAGARINWYRVDSVLGAGGFGVTYLATDTNLQHQVAVKEYLPRDVAWRDGTDTVRAAGPEHDVEYAQGLSRFLVEARTLARFRHPSIVRVYSVFEAHGTAYMVMEYQRGQNLARAIKDGRFADEGRLLEMLFALLEGLSMVHSHGFVHRDIKPDNILIGERGRPVLLDFGSARKTIDLGALTSFVSPGFSPIEQYDPSSDDRRQGPWTDIYSIGATLYRSIVRRGPVDAVSRANALISRRDDLHVPISEIAPDGYSEELLCAIDCALAFHPEDRPQSVAEWAALLPPPPTQVPETDLLVERTLLAH